MISTSFFQRDPLTCSRELIGCELVWGDCAGIVVETEAYLAVGDEACHTFARKSAREFIETHEAGSAYIYLNYGVHWLLNALIKGGEEEGFILIRAVEPTRGIELMQKRRHQVALRELGAGPGKLTQAMNVLGSDHGISLCADPKRCFLFKPPLGEVIADTRIGISKAAHHPWRFLLKGSEFVSRKASWEAKKRPDWLPNPA